MSEGEDLKPKCRSLVVGVDDGLRTLIAKTIAPLNPVVYPFDIDKLIEGEFGDAVVVFVSLPPEGVSVDELAQLLRSQYQSAPIYLLLRTSDRQDRATLMKNGFTDVFFLPFDLDVMKTSVETILQAFQTGAKSYRSIKLVDMKDEAVFDFDTYVYLPANNKHIRFSAANQPVGADRFARLTTKQVTSLFIPSQDMPKFYDHIAKHLRTLGKGDGLSETERSEKLRESVRGLMAGMFSDTTSDTDQGRKVIEDCRRIVRSFMTDGSDKQDWYRKLLAASTGMGDSYSQAATVSSYASLIAMGLGLKTVEEIALAGLLHNIGMAAMPLEMLNRNPADWTPEEKKIYETHPDQSLAMIKERKLVLPDLVYKIIGQHHERYTGGGYPKNLPATRMIVEAQVLAFADRFEELMSTAPGKLSLSPAQAIETIRNEVFADPGKSFINPDLMKQIAALFPKSNEPTAIA